jgi:hypothetical protein
MPSAEFPLYAAAAAAAIADANQACAATAAAVVEDRGHSSWRQSADGARTPPMAAREGMLLIHDLGGTSTRCAMWPARLPTPATWCARSCCQAMVLYRATC